MSHKCRSKPLAQHWQHNCLHWVDIHPCQCNQDHHYQHIHHYKHIYKSLFCMDSSLLSDPQNRHFGLTRKINQALNRVLVSIQDASVAHSGGVDGVAHSSMLTHAWTPFIAVSWYPGLQAHVKDPSVSVHCESEL